MIKKMKTLQILCRPAELGSERGKGEILQILTRLSARDLKSDLSWMSLEIDSKLFLRCQISSKLLVSGAVHVKPKSRFNQDPCTFSQHNFPIHFPNVKNFLICSFAEFQFNYKFSSWMLAKPQRALTIRKWTKLRHAGGGCAHRTMAPAASAIHFRSTQMIKIESHKKSWP